MNRDFAGEISVRARRGRRLAAALVVAAALVAAARPAVASPSDFPRPARLRTAIEFWKRVFASYSKHQVVVHDTADLGKVYEVLDFRSWADDRTLEPAALAAYRRAEADSALERYRAILVRLDALGPAVDPAGLGAEERKVYAMWADDPDPRRFAAAAGRLRTQTGLRENFFRGLKVQSRYIDRMEGIFAARGMPVELARLPLIESSFNVEAYSKVGAAGVWQFMPSTGRQYMRVANDVDERRDPIRATAAAADHLGGDYRALGAWPLAITAWNHGRGGVARGVAEVGSGDIGEVATRYHGRAFGFASRNFYAEFVAVIEIIEVIRGHWAPIHTRVPLDVVEVRLEQPMRVETASRILGLPARDLHALNPALMAPVVSGAVAMPTGYTLRVPGHAAGAVTALRAAEPELREARPREPELRTARRREPELRALPADRERVAARGTAAGRVARDRGRADPRIVVHRVSRGQTLAEIARRYGTTVALIQGMNKVKGSVPAGRLLRVPRSDT